MAVWCSCTTLVWVAPGAASIVCFALLVAISATAVFVISMVDTVIAGVGVVDGVSDAVNDWVGRMAVAGNPPT
jgi:hypothetical protein